MERQTRFDDQHILWRAYKQVNIGFEASDEFVFHKVWRFTPIITICVELSEIWMDTKVPSRIGQCIFIQVLIERSLYSSCLFSNVDSSRRLLKSTRWCLGVAPWKRWRHLPSHYPGSWLRPGSSIDICDNVRILPSLTHGYISSLMLRFFIFKWKIDSIAPKDVIVGIPIG